MPSFIRSDEWMQFINPARIDADVMDDNIGVMTMGDDDGQQPLSQQQPEEEVALRETYNKVDFERFLKEEIPQPLDCNDITTSFLSKDLPLPDVWESKDDSTIVFSSLDDELKLPPPVDLGLSIQALPELQRKKSARKMPPSDITTNDKNEYHNDGVVQEKMFGNKTFPSSNWTTLGPHIDAPSYSPEDIFDSDSDSEDDYDPSFDHPSPPKKTDWNDLYFSQMQFQLPPQHQQPQPQFKPLQQPSQPQQQPQFEPQVSPFEVEHGAPQAMPARIVENETPLATATATAPIVATAAATVAKKSTKISAASRKKKVAAPKKKRIRAPRKKPVPDVKVYTDPKDMDVLLGRGGRSNHHPGNKKYRDEVKNLKPWYHRVTERDEKTHISQLLVDYVRAYQGRFLEKDKEGWYEVPNIVARRKASQALREDDDAEKRAAKRQRYLAKKEEGAGKRKK